MAPEMLIVEDEPELLRARAVRFGAAGFRCEIACNGKGALLRWCRGTRAPTGRTNCGMPASCTNPLIPRDCS